MPTRGWNDQELEKFLGWLEDNQLLLRGSTALWTAKAKETLFADNDDIDAKKIKSKYHNMKNSWKAAKTMQEQSGFGVKEDDCSSSVNGRSAGSLQIVKHRLLILPSQRS